MVEERQEDEQHERKGPLPRIGPLLEQEDRHREHEESERLLRHRAREHEEASEQRNEQARRKPDGPSTGRLHAEQVCGQDDERRDQDDDELDVRERRQPAEHRGRGP